MYENEYLSSLLRRSLHKQRTGVHEGQNYYLDFYCYFCKTYVKIFEFILVFPGEKGGAEDWEIFWKAKSAIEKKI